VISGLYSTVYAGGAGSSRGETESRAAPGVTARRKSRPILEDIQNYLQTERPKLFAQESHRCSDRLHVIDWEALLRYTEDGDLQIDNNAAERSLRPIVVGRGNWLFLRERPRGKNRSRTEHS